MPALDSWRGEQVGDVAGLLASDRKENQIEFYKPVSPVIARFHETAAHLCGIGGGNGSGKSEGVLAEIVMCATGVFPQSLRHLAERKYRGPIQARVVCESITTTLHNIILPKLKWQHWTGVDRPGGDRGHWGWIPRRCLQGGEWDKSWSAAQRTLTLKCFDPVTGGMEGASTIQFMSRDQDSTDFASGDFHLVMLDEPPSHAIFRENQARTMRVDGRLILSFTWPDDPSVPVDWIYDELYEKARPGADKNPDIDWFEIHTTDNPHIDQKAVANQMAKWDAATRSVRIYGRPIRFANLVHPAFADAPTTWCMPCGASVVPEAGKCTACGSDRLVEMCHVAEVVWRPEWPVVRLIDPHPRKPHMVLYAGILPDDDYYVLANLEVAAEPAGVKEKCDEIERELGLRVMLTLGDPNMLRSPSGTKREITWEDDFRAAGISIDLASDTDVGRGRLNEYLKPDPYTDRPRIRFHPRAVAAIGQMKRYAWDDYRNVMDRDQKQTPRHKYDDYPTLLKYLMNYLPSFRQLVGAATVVNRWPGRNRGEPMADKNNRRPFWKEREARGMR